MAGPAARSPLTADTSGRGEAERYLHDVAQRLLAGSHVETAVYAGAADAAILVATRRYRADVLVMATHTRPPLAGLLYGSVARANLGRSPVPILLIRSWPPDTASAPTTSPSHVRVTVGGCRSARKHWPPR